MQTRRVEFTSLIGLSGAAVWAGLAVLSGLRRAPLGVIELLFLFAVLVVVPLGLELMIVKRGAGTRAEFAAAFQPIAAVAVVAAFWQKPGPIAAALSAPWLVLGIVVAVAGALNLFQNSERTLADLVIGLAGVDLVFAGGWLMVSRAGLHPMGFQEPIVLLTSVHFHYSGFAVAVLAAAATRCGERRSVSFRFLRAIVWLVLFLPFLLAAGFVVSPVLRVAAALGLAVTVPVFAGYLFWAGQYLDQRVARSYLRSGAVAAWFAMGLAGMYAVTDYFGRPFLTMPGMASTHGLLNGIGFVLCSMLAFLIEENAIESAKSQQVPVRSVVAGAVMPRKHPASVPSPIPEFVAREFYDQ